MIALIIISVILSCATLCMMIVFFVRKPKGSQNISDIVEIAQKDDAILQKNIEAKIDAQTNLYKSMNEMLIASIQGYNKSILDYLTSFNSTQGEQYKMIEGRLNAMLASLETKQEKIVGTLSENLKNIQSSNDKKLEEMRQTVDEKLSATLEKRLSDSVKVINDGLDQVFKGVGEMKNIASGMGDFKKMLTNVKSRGGWGEVQLGVLLEQMMSSQQFASQVSIDGKLDRVDFVIKLPGKDEQNILLPIDAKFPMEDYIRICDAAEKGDLKEIESNSKALERRIKDEAKKISDKYIKVPITTDFAVMYLPIEGLYAEVIKNASLIETIQRDYKVLVCGPTTLTALINSLQMGFRTLAIEKRSSEIWNLLGVFKQEFNKFVELLSKTQKKLDEASNTIEFATKKTKTIQRKLKNVSIGDEELLIEEDIDD